MAAKGRISDVRQGFRQYPLVAHSGRPQWRLRMIPIHLGDGLPAPRWMPALGGFCRSGAMLEGRCPAQTCRPRRLKISGGSRGSLPRTPLIVQITTFALFRLRLTTRFRDVNGSRFFLGGARSGFPRRKNLVTRTLRWSGVRMEQPGSTTLRLLATAITERICAGTRELRVGSA
jgi:hypothetical protein